jgi:hypothetical protein
VGVSAAEDLTADVLSRTDGNIDLLRKVIDQLDQELASRPLDRVVRLWDVSASQLGRMFDVSRQAATTWLHDGPPAARADQVALLDQSTNLLEQWIKRERIPAVVRRPVDQLGGRSRLETALAGEFGLLHDELLDTFDVSRIAP